jgi:23S rRNA (guanosine2251-2'-O)-methyltransferase
MSQLEGRQSILAALHARQRKFQVILIRHGTHAEGVQEVIDTATQFGVPIRYVDGAELDSLAHGSSHGGMLAICSAKPRAAVKELIEVLSKLSGPPLLLLLEGVDDARNLGFTLRSAEALGVHAVLIKKHLWDFDETEVARPASGAYERMPLVQIDDVQPLIDLQKSGLQLIGCLANVKQTIYDADFRKPTILAVGGEKRGLSGAVRSICNGFVTIPSKSDASSLSLSHASAIIMGEAMRQRRILQT